MESWVLRIYTECLTSCSTTSITFVRAVPWLQNHDSLEDKQMPSILRKTQKNALLEGVANNYEASQLTLKHNVQGYCL